MSLNAELKIVVQRTSLERAYRIGCANSICKPVEGAVAKSCGAERSGKGAVQKLLGGCKEAEQH